MSFWCDPWNPAPFQSRPGLLDDPQAPKNQWNNNGCYDQTSVAPYYTLITEGNPITLRRQMQNHAGAQSGELLYRDQERAKQLWGKRLGLQMWLEWYRMEFAWNRNGFNIGGGGDRAYALWEEYPHPNTIEMFDQMLPLKLDPTVPEDRVKWMDWRMRVLGIGDPPNGPKWFMATDQWHGEANYWNIAPAFLKEAFFTPRVESISLWQHSKLPSDPTFDSKEFSDFDYEVWAVECQSVGPSYWGRWIAPYMLDTFEVKGFTGHNKNNKMKVIPRWL